MHRIEKFVFKPYFTTKHKRGVYIWDRLSRPGLKSIVANVPIIHKPYPIDGCMIAGFLAIDRRNITYPPSLIREIRRIVPSYEVSIVKPYPLTKRVFVMAYRSDAHTLLCFQVHA